MRATLVSLAAALALSPSFTHAFWRLECDGNSGLARLDPLMSPGSPSDHVHSIKGGSAFSTTATADDLLNSKCTSCGIAQDMSAYWAPAMYFIHQDGTTELVPEKPPHKSYYLIYPGLTHDGKKQTVEAFPNGFQMIAGNNFRRNTTIPDPDPNPLGPWPDSTQDDRAQRATGFNCLHYAAGNDEPTLRRHHLPDKAFLDANCVDGVRLEMQFPSCWNGKLDGGPTHKSHVAYPDGVSVGNCPPGYDRRLITLMYETIVATDQFRGKPGRFVLANGDPTGFGYHGDFIAAWKDNALEKALQQCNQQDSSGMMEECSVFKMTDNSGQCKMQSPLPPAIAKEDVLGPMKGLANGLQVSNGPAPAPKTQSGSSSPPPPQKPPVAAKPAQQKQPHQNKKQRPPPAQAPPKVKAVQKNHVNELAKPKKALPTTLRSIASSSFSTSSAVPPPTHAPDPPPRLKAGEKLLGTTLTTKKDGHVVKIIRIQKDVFVTKDVPVKRHVHKHLKQHAHHRGRDS